MAGYQNNMRYGRPGNMYQQRNAGCGCGQRMPERRENNCRNEQCMPERRENSCRNEQCMPERQENECCRERRMPERCEEREQQECRKEKKDCDCGSHRDELAGMPLAMAYVPWQKWCKVYDVCEGFQRGTIFKELDMPFEGRGGCNR